MADKIGISFKAWDLQHNANGAALTKKIEDIYDTAAIEAVKLAKAVAKTNPNKIFTFDDLPGAKKLVDEMFYDIAAASTKLMQEATQAEWLFSCAKNDALVKSLLNTSNLTEAQMSQYFNRNMEALIAFQQRKVNGMGISARVWNYTEQLKQELELSLDVGLAEGLSASQLTKNIRQYLKEPNMLFRRVRDKHGNLVLSKAAKAYHPGQGVYRSSYKNAMRLARTEANMAYRTADHERWQQLDFILGFEVKLSNNHTLNGKPFTDICDMLAGKYPKGFKFTGWHPHCRCAAIPILASVDEFTDYQARVINGEDMQGHKFGGTIEKLPNNFINWAKDNNERILKANSLPYFIKDNFKEQSEISNPAAWVNKAPSKAISLPPAPKGLVAKEVQQQAFMQYEKDYAAKKLAEADEMGITGKAYDELVAALQNPDLTYSQIANKSNKLYTEIKAAKNAVKLPVNPYSKEALIKQFTEEEVDGLFASYEKFNAKIENLDLDGKIKKLEFELDYLAKHGGKYKTSGVMGEMLKKDLATIKAKHATEAITAQANSLINQGVGITDAGVKKAVKNLSAEIGKVGTTPETIQKAIEAAQKEIEAYNLKNLKTLSDLDISFFNQGDKYDVTKHYNPIEKNRVQTLRENLNQAITKHGGNIRTPDAKFAQQRLADELNELAFKYRYKQEDLKHIAVQVGSDGKAKVGNITDVKAKKHYERYINAQQIDGGYSHPVGGVFDNSYQSDRLKKYVNKLNSYAGPTIDHEVSIPARYFAGQSFINQYILGVDKLHAKHYTGLEALLNDYTPALSYSLNKMPRYQGFTYRGVDNRYGLLDELQETFKNKKPFIHKTVMSTSTSIDVADGFGRDITFKVYGRSGTYGDEYSVYSGEKEVLFRAGSKFEILEMYQEKGDNGIANRGCWTVVLKEIL